MSSGPVIVCVAYNRPTALKRLLDGLLRVVIPDGVQAPLVVSIDGDDAEVRAVADAFAWPHGSYRVRTNTPRLGLRRHVLSCGDLSQEHGAAIVLEDDLYPSVDLYRYALAALAQYGDDDRLGGIALYSHPTTERWFLRFHPLDDASDTFFLQIPASSGQMYSAAQWKSFRDWYDENQHEGVTLEHGVPNHVTEWSPNSWKKFYLRYLVQTRRQFVYPRQALTTNCGDVGFHFPIDFPSLSAPLSRGRTSWRWGTLDDDAAAHDAWFEPTADALRARFPGVLPDDVTIDLMGTRPAEGITTEWLLSSRPCSRPAQTFPLTLLPLGENLAIPGGGQFFSLGRARDFGPQTVSRHRALFEICNGQILRSVRKHVLLEEVMQRVTKGRVPTGWSDEPGWLRYLLRWR